MSFEKHIPDIYSTTLQLNKANTSDKETSFRDLHIKHFGSEFHTSVCDKRVDFIFPIVNFPWLSFDVPRLPSYVVYISQFAWCCSSYFDFHSKTLEIICNYWHRVTYITSFEKHLECSLGYTLSFWLHFCIVTLRFVFFCAWRGFWHRNESDLFFFLFTREEHIDNESAFMFVKKSFWTPV